MKRICFLLIACLAPRLLLSFAAQGPGEIRALFLGDNGLHRPADRFKQLQPEMAKRGIELTYTDSLASLSPIGLRGYDSIVIFANHTRIQPDQERALLEFVEKGGGLVPLHCASFCFLNSDKYIELVGGQFKSHGQGVFKETIVASDHPVMQGVEAIESWDESYVHARHNTNRTVLAERRDAKGAEPYTWVREHGKGRVFYTAWGHDERTWGNANFQQLVENGIRWASANSPAQLQLTTGLKPLEYMDAAGPLPNYVPNARWGTQSDPIRTMQRPLEPEESLKHLAVFPEFEKTLFASEPEIVKPIWLSWDERGRLWIAETVDYPNDMQPLGQGRDRLKICEDTDNDGRADKFTVFADKLSVPTGFVFANGGVIVIHSGKTEFLKDTDGDDKADERKDLFVGWGTRDTHAGPSNLRYGFDNWIWGVVGYSGFEGTVGGKAIRFGQGIMRFKPDGSALEFIRSSNNNTWGLGLSEEGIIFGSTANGNASMYMPIPNRFYEGVSGWSASRIESIADSQRFFPLTAKVRQVDYHGKYTAGAGSALYTARSFPREYWNRAQFVTEPTGHLIGLFFIEAHGSDFVAHNARNFAASDDDWTSPVVAEVGPDGALWVSDWYNYIIQHNPTPQGFENGRGNAYETPLRDKTHGRIYRIAHKNGKPSPSASLRDATGPQLVAALRNDNLLWRLHAQRLIIEGRKTDLIPALVELTADQKLDQVGLNPGATHALFALHGLGSLSTTGANGQAVEASAKALTHPAAGVRRAAVTVLPRSEAGLNHLLQSGVLNDKDAQVRLAALLSLSEMPRSDAAGAAIFAMLQDPANAQDRWIPEAATAAAARHDSAFLKAVLTSYKPTTSVTNSQAPGNLVRNSSFETVDGERPANWRATTHNGRGEFQVSNVSRSGDRSALLSSEQGADISWSAQVTVKPRTDYLLSGWIKTEGVRNVGGARGALLNVHQLQDPVKGATKPLTGDNEWTKVELLFNTGALTEITVNCLLGGWGRASGKAYYDDIELTRPPGSELAGEVGRVVRLVTTHYAQRGPVESIIPTLTSLKDASPAIATAVLDGLVAGWPTGTVPTIGADETQELLSVMKALPEGVRDRVLALALRWGNTKIFGEQVAEITATLKKQIANTDAAPESRVAAAKRLVALDDSEVSTGVVLEQVTLLTPPVVGSGFVSALTESRNDESSRSILAHWENFSPAVRRSAVAALMRKPEWTRALLDAVEQGKVHQTELAADHWSQLKQNPNRGIARRAERLSIAKGTTTADREEIVKKLLPLANEPGELARGKEVYTATCAVCHLFQGQGGKVGPDLTGIAAKGSSEILVDILDPNRSVEANYRLWTVSTKEGETYSGRLEAETQTTVEILDTTGQKHVIPRKEIATLEGSQISIMPTGFEALSPDDIKALLTYMTQVQ